MAYSPSTFCSGCYNLRSTASEMAYPAYGLTGPVNPTPVLPSGNDLSSGSMLSNSFYGKEPPWDTIADATNTNYVDNRSHASEFQDSTPSFQKEANVGSAANEPSPRSMLSDSFYGEGNPWGTVPNASEVNSIESRNDDSGFQVQTPPAKKASIKKTTSSKPPATRTKKQPNSPSSPSPSPSPFICKWAKCKSPGPFGCKSSLMRHVESQHVAPRSVRCSHEACQKVFSRKNNMVMHARAVHGTS